MSEVKKPHLGAAFYWSLKRLQPVHNNIQTEPDHINEVPVPGSTFKREVMVCCEVTFQDTVQNDGQHDRAPGHVEAMEAGQHEEGRTIDA